jgi:hypothetical protein
LKDRVFAAIGHQRAGVSDRGYEQLVAVTANKTWATFEYVQF